MKLFKYVLSFFPTSLPHGVDEFNSWANDILGFAKCPDNDSTRFALAVMILHCNSTEDTKPKRYFVRALNKAASNEIANDIAQGFKRKQQAENEAKIKADIEKATQIQVTDSGISQNGQVQETAS